MSEYFTAKVGEFEGPIGTLLSMIENRKLHISEVSLAQITDDYITFVNGRDLPKNDMANFIVIASTLMLIKSLALLPTLKITDEEKTDIEELKRRLKIYQIHKNQSKKLETMLKNGKKMRGRQVGKVINPVFSPTDEIQTNSLLESIKKILNSFSFKEVLPQVVVRKIISLEEVIVNLTERIQRSFKMSFNEFSKGQEKVNIIVSFLGMLELVKNGIIEVKQDQMFSNIEMENTHTDVPKYN